jgi:hypothetical protein
VRRRNYDARRPDASLRESGSEGARIPHLPQHARRTPPQRAAAGQLFHRGRVVLQAGEIDDGIGRDVARGGHDRLGRERRSEIPWQRQRPDGWMLIEVAIRVERNHVETGPRCGLGRRARRDADNEHRALRFQVRSSGFRVRVQMFGFSVQLFWVLGSLSLGSLSLGSFGERER